MNNFLKKYLKDLHLEVRFKPLVNGELEITLIDNSYNIRNSIILSEDNFKAFEGTDISDSEMFNTILSPLLSEMGDKKASIYSNRYKAHIRQELDRFWRGE